MSGQMGGSMLGNIGNMVPNPSTSQAYQDMVRWAWLLFLSLSSISDRQAVLDHLLIATIITAKVERD